MMSPTKDLGSELKEVLKAEKEVETTSTVDLCPTVRNSRRQDVLWLGRREGALLLLVVLNREKRIVVLACMIFRFLVGWTDS